MVDYDYEKLIKDAADSLSDKEKEEILRKIGVLDESGNVTEKYREVFVKGVSEGCPSERGCDDCDWIGPCMRHPKR